MRALCLLAFALLLAMTTWFSATAVVPQLRSIWRLTSTETALLTIAVQLGFVAGALLSSLFNLADVIGARRLMFVGAIGAAAVNALLVLSGGGAPAILLRFLTGAFLAVVYPPALKAMATWFREGRGTALGVLVGALTLGSAAPHLINASGGLDWRVVILATSALTLLGGLIAGIVFREGPYRFPSSPFNPRQLDKAFANRAMRLTAIGYFGHMWELYAMWAWFAAFFGDVLVVHRADQPYAGAALATFLVIGIGGLGCIIGGALGDRWGRARSTVLAMAISGTCAVLIGLTRDAPVALVLTLGLVWGLWVVADSAQFSTIVTEVADQRYVGTALTAQLGVGFTLTVLTIWLVPILRDQLGWTWTFAFLAPGPLIGVIAMTQLMRLPEDRLVRSGRG